MKVGLFFRAYVTAALWSSTDARGGALEDTSAPVDLSTEAILQMVSDCADFLAANLEDLQASRLTPEQAGHDFWLTRNGHGGGFWDRGLQEVGERLTSAAEAFGGQDLYVGDDGRLYVS